MRVIGGEFGSRRLVAPAGMGTRPSSDRLRETLFNVLGERVVGVRFLDLYAGSGAVGIEALSRGATEAVFAERGAAALKALRGNLRALGVEERAVVVERPVAAALGRVQGEFGVVFLDPPYVEAREYAATLGALGSGGPVASGGLVVAEHASRDTLAPSYGRLRRVRELRQGDAGLSFFEVEEGGGGSRAAGRS